MLHSMFIKLKQRRLSCRLSDWLRKMNAYTAQNPIYLHTEFGRMGKDPTLTMTGAQGKT